MGIFINMIISQSVTHEEWERAYQETLELVKAFPLAELRMVPIRGIETMCLVRTEEREYTYHGRRGEEKVRRCWFAHGDYTFCRVAEDYHLPRDIVDDESYDADAPDALYQMTAAHVRGYDRGDPRFRRHYNPWGSKTQGEPYHMYLLAIGCLIAARLGPKAYLYGDITMGQCQRAVGMANEHLREPIEVPDWCDVARLFERIDTVPLTESERIQLFDGCYLGRRDVAFGTFLRDHFSGEACDAYWEDRLQRWRFRSIGFMEALKEYLQWGFDLDRLCPLVRFEDGESADPYADFVTMVMDMKLHLPEKDCTDVLEIDADDGEPYGVGTLLARVALSGARNRKVDRYIPIEEIRSALRSGIGERCPVDALIDAYLEKEAAGEVVRLMGEEPTEVFEKAVKSDPAQAMNDVVKAKTQRETKLAATYDIDLTKYLPLYRPGDSISPNVIRSACTYLEFCRKATTEDTYRSLMEAEPRERCLWLAGKSGNVILRHTEWEKIYDDIMANPESFARYYPLGRVSVTSAAIENVARAFATNDDLWSHAAELENGRPE